MSLIDVQKLAIKRNENLGNPKLGGQLFLGKHYAKSNILFLGLNPGLWKFGGQRRNYVLENFGSMPFWTDLLLKNVLIDTAEGDFVFWKRSTRFFSRCPQIRKRMEKATYCFAIPWRTANNNDLTQLINEKPEIEQFSKEILEIILKDCKPKFIFIAGQNAKEKIEKMFFNQYVFQECDEGINFDNNHRFQIYKTDDFHIIQIPHVSRANDYDKLDKIADRMNEELKELDFFTP